MSQMLLFDMPPTPKPNKGAAAPARDESLTLWEQWHHWKPQAGYIVIIKEMMANSTTGSNHYVNGMEAQVISIQDGIVICQATIEWYYQQMAKEKSITGDVMGKQFALPYQVCAPIFADRINRGYSFPKPEDTPILTT